MVPPLDNTLCGQIIISFALETRLRLNDSLPGAAGGDIVLLFGIGQISKTA
jgi:hypothetical protein